MWVDRILGIEAEHHVWYEPGSPQLFAVIRHVWSLADRICPLRFPPGVHKHRTIEQAEALRERWEEANFLAHQERMRSKTPS
jgi:hypothetical protein